MPFDLDAFIFLNRNLGLHIYLGGEENSVVGREYLNLRAAYNLNTGLSDCRFICVWQYFVYRVVIKIGFAVDLFDYAARSPARPEARDIYFLNSPAVCILNCSLECFFVNRKLKGVEILIGFFGLDQTH